jgi:two-component system response regulator PhoP
VRILIIEDEAPARDQLHHDISQRGCKVNLAADGEEGLFLGSEYTLDAAIIDLGLPKIPGMEVLRCLRDIGRKFPIPILTARCSWQEKVSGWTSPVLVCGPVELDTHRHCVTVNGRPVALSNFEFRILEHLMLSAGKVVTKQELAECMYDDELEPQSNVIEVHVAQVRRKLDPRDELKPIETIRGRGYLFAAPRKS